MSSKSDRGKSRSDDDEDDDNGSNGDDILKGILGLLGIAGAYGFIMATGAWISEYPYDAFRLTATLAAVGYVVYRLLRWRLYQETRGASRELYEAVLAQVVAVGLPDDEKSFTKALTDDLRLHLNQSGLSPLPLPLTKLFVAGAFKLYIGQRLAQIDMPPDTDSRIDNAAYRDRLRRVQETLGRTALAHLCLKPFVSSYVAMARRVRMQPERPSEMLASVSDIVPDAGKFTQDMLGAFYDPALSSAHLYDDVRTVFDANALRVAQAILPTAEVQKGERLRAVDHKGSATEIFEAYLKGSFLLDVLKQGVPFELPLQERFNHAYVLGGSGHGKTQALQYLIARDLDLVARREASIIVIDSQGDLIENIARLDVFAPHHPLHDRLCLIDPTDVEYPIALNLFDAGVDRLKGYSQLQREQLLNGLLELYDFVLASLLGAAMTRKQATLFHYLVRAMLVIPDATIHTFSELLKPNGGQRIRKYFDQLPPSARDFFETQFDDQQFERTRQEVSWRLAAILENQTFERMFSHPRSKLNLFAEMNAGKVILIKSAKSLLKEYGCEIFGRFFLAMIAQAAQERATLPESKRLPTFVYVDECHDYAAKDPNIKVILEQARKQKVGIVLAHQYLGQLDAGVRDAIFANTAIKMAGGVSDADGHALARELRAAPSLIAAQPKLSFATYVRNQTPAAVSVAFPLRYLEKLPKMSPSDAHVIREMNRARYAVPLSELERRASERRDANKKSPRDDTGADSDEPSSSW